jgi:hypothetical protein
MVWEIKLRYKYCFTTFNIWELTRSIVLHSGSPDRLVWKWTTDQCFSTASAYGDFFIGQVDSRSQNLVEDPGTGKCKLFVWLVLHDRC